MKSRIHIKHFNHLEISHSSFKQKQQNQHRSPSSIADIHSLGTHGRFFVTSSRKQIHKLASTIPHFIVKLCDLFVLFVNVLLDKSL